MATRFGVLVALAVALLPGSAGAHGGLIMMGQGTATVDGALGPAEWGDAAQVDFPALLPAHDGGGTVPVRLFVMNDAANLYLAVRVQRSTFGPTQALFVFDRNHDGANGNGDDQLGITAGPLVATEFQDGYRWTCAGAVGPTPAFCGAAQDTTRLEGSPPPGNVDGRGAFSIGGGFTTIELSHPLNTADDAHDFSLAPQIAAAAAAKRPPLGILAVADPRERIRDLRKTQSIVQLSPDASRAARSPSPFAPRAASSCAVSSSS